MQSRSWKSRLELMTYRWREKSRASPAFPQAVEVVGLTAPSFRRRQQWGWSDWCCWPIPMKNSCTPEIGKRDDRAGADACWRKRTRWWCCSSTRENWENWSLQMSFTGSLTQQQQPKGVIRTLLDWPELKLTKARSLKTAATARWFQLQLLNNWREWTREGSAETEEKWRWHCKQPEEIEPIYWSFTEPSLKQPLKHDRMKVIDQGKETVLRVDDDADWSRETERDKGGGGDRSRKEGWGEEEGFGSNKEESRERWPDRGRSGAGNGHFNHFYNQNIFF